MAQGDVFVEIDSVFADVVAQDSLNLEEDFVDTETDTIQPAGVIENLKLFDKKPDKSAQQNDKQLEFKPNPKKAVLYAAVFPGLGQIYNRKYWKLPIVYGGFIGCAYAITWNGTQYNDYRQAYQDINNGGDSWHNYLPLGVNPETITQSQITYYTNAFKNKKDFYRRNRDLSIIITVGLYALCMLDAYVDAQLFDFDISPDLSMRIEPVIFNKSEFYSHTLGLQCSIKF